MVCIQVKVTNRCNLNCKGCFNKYVGSDESKKFDIVMVFKSFCKLVDAYKDVNLNILGGEPLLIGEELIDFISMVRNKYPKIPINIFTNGLLINDDWVNSFRKYGVKVVFTYRGCYDLFDRAVCLDGAYDIWKKNFLMCKESKIDVGVLGYIPIEFESEWFNRCGEMIDELESLGVSVLSLNETDAIDNKVKYADFVIKAQEYIFENDYKLKISILYGLYRILSCRGGRIFWQTNCSAIRCIYPDGQIGAFCIRGPKCDYGVYPECLKCPIYGLCLGGCRSIREHNEGKNPYCEDRLKIYKYVCENLNRFYLHYDFLR